MLRNQTYFFSGVLKLTYAEYDLTLEKNKLINDDWMYMVKFRRQNLIPNDNFELNIKPLEVSASIEIFGDISRDEFFINNEDILNIIENDIEIIAET